MHLVDLGASGLIADSNVVWAQCKDTPIDGEEAPAWEQAPVMCALGVSARPAPANAEGAAIGLVEDNVGGFEGVLVAAYDPRANKQFGEIRAGETVLHSTGPDFDSQVLCKEQLLAFMVGDDHAVIIDRKNEQIMLTAPGGAFKICKKDGIVLTPKGGKSTIQVKGSTVLITGDVILGGRQPKAKVADASKILQELVKIAAGIATGGGSYTPPPLGVGANGVFIGG